MEMVQIHTFWSMNQGTINEVLRAYPTDYPKREIMGVSLANCDQGGWFVTITYKLTMR